jgi:hypothetical protein
MVAYPPLLLEADSSNNSIASGVARRGIFKKLSGAARSVRPKHPSGPRG